MVLAKEGLFFIQINIIKDPLNSDTKFDLKLQDEKYFEKQTVKGAFEYKEGKLIAIVNGKLKISFLDRNNNKELENNSINNLS